MDLIRYPLEIGTKPLFWEIRSWFVSGKPNNCQKQNFVQRDVDRGQASEEIRSNFHKLWKMSDEFRLEFRPNLSDEKGESKERIGNSDDGGERGRACKQGGL